MKLWEFEELPDFKNLQIAVVGHVEWVTFLKVDALPKAGIISHAQDSFEEAAGGGAVTAIQLNNLIPNQVHLITALGKDDTGERSLQRLKELGIKVSVAWRDKPTRKGISLVDSNGDRAITVIGPRLQPLGEDKLPWDQMINCNGVFITAANKTAIKYCRNASVLVATPRVSIKTLNDSGVKLDALIGSGLDPDEKLIGNEMNIPPTLRISTEGELGGQSWPGGRFKTVRLKEPISDAYGCGDSFAAGVTAGLSAGWEKDKAISLGCHLGAKCATHYGPYARKDKG